MVKQIFKTTATFAVLSLIFFAFSPSVFAALSGVISINPPSATPGQPYSVTANVTGEWAGQSISVSIQESKPDGTWLYIHTEVCNSGQSNRCEVVKSLDSGNPAGTYIYYAVLNAIGYRVTSAGKSIVISTTGGAPPPSTTPPPPPPPPPPTTPPPTTPPPTTPPPPITPPATGGTPGSGVTTIVNLKDLNPLKVESFEDLLNALMGFIFWVGLAVAPLVIIIAGFLYVTSAGNPQMIEKAKTMILYAIIGLVVLLLATGLVEVVKSIIGVK